MIEDTHRYEPMTPEMRPQDPTQDGKRTHVRDA